MQILYQKITQWMVTLHANIYQKITQWGVTLNANIITENNTVGGNPLCKYYTKKYHMGGGNPVYKYYARK